MNPRGGKAKAVVLPGEHHDFDADYYKNYWSTAQNPIKCSRMIAEGKITLEDTGDQFPNNADGYKKMLNKCMAWGLTSGYTKDRHVGEPHWIAHFSSNL